MTPADAAYFAETMSDLQRETIVICSRQGTLGYTRIAEKLGVSYADAKNVGGFLQAANLATIELLKPGFNGSGIFLNERGEQVKLAALKAKSSNAPNN